MGWKKMSPAVLLALAASSQAVGAPEVTVPELVTVRALNTENKDSGRYVVEGYVILVATCPPCPKDAVCETCLPDHLLISDIKKSSQLTNSRISDQELAVLIRGAAPKTKRGVRYRMELRTQAPLTFTGKYADSLRQRTELLWIEAIQPH